MNHGIKGQVGKWNITWMTSPRGPSGTAHVEIEGLGKTEVAWRRDDDGIWIELADGCYGFDLRRTESDDGRRSYDVLQRGSPLSWKDVSFLRAGEENLVAAQAGKKKNMRVRAQMPGKIIRLLVKPGEFVSLGQPLLVMEAMKMENEIRAGCDGQVQDIKVSEGQAVESGADLILIEGK